MVFNPVAFIETKRDGGMHTPEDLKAFVEACQAGSMADYQIAAWLMAAFLRGLDREELKAFTWALGHSGEMVTLPANLRCVDKHSSGGVGDKVTLVAVPLVAACGVPVAKLSGRGLGFTGGTVDKLDAVPGFCSHLSLEVFVRQVETLGCAISGHSLSLAPAERLFYTLRDVTGTVPSRPLIASSIVSKKIAGGARRFVFDVKVGKGAFSPRLEDARALASLLMDLSADLGAQSLAMLTAMDVPLGRWVGNAVEVREVIDVLSDRGPEDTRALCLAVGGAMVFLGGGAENLEEGREMVRRALTSGKALEKFVALLQAQGGDPRVVENPARLLPIAPEVQDVVASNSGVLHEINARYVGEALRLLGGGRYRKDDVVDPGVAVEMLVRPGDRVGRGEPLVRFYGRDTQRLEEACRLVASGVILGEVFAPPPLVHEIIVPGSTAPGPKMS